MKRFFNILLGIVSWGVILAYLIAASRYCTRQEEARVVNRIRVVVTDSATQRIITPDMVRGWLAKEGLKIRSMALDEVDTRAIRKLVEGHGYVREAKVYTDISGTLTIELRQRRPVARVNTENGYGFYLTDDGYVLPLQSHEVIYVPMITGRFTPPFARGYIGKMEDALPAREKKTSENYLFFNKLINFVNYISSDDFWNAQIVQIEVSESPAPQGDPAWEEPQVALVPRAGNHVILLGSLDDADRKLEKLQLFYRDALGYEGWDAPKVINLKFKNQVICTK